MAESSLFARALEWLGPNKSAVIEDESAPPATGEIISRSGETFLIPGAWMKRIAESDDKILARGGGVGLQLYEDLLDDDVAMSNFQQRRLAVISREWEVAPGDDNDPRSVEAADHLRANLKSIAFDRICDRMLYAVWFGYGVAEGLYELGPDGKYRLADIVVPDRKFFGFTLEGELRFRPGISLSGEQLPPNKFWTLRTGASHDFAFYGLGLAHWCYWPIWFKRNVIKFWALYLEKLGYPTVVGEQDDNWSDAEKQGFLSALVNIGRDRAVKVPKGALSENGIQLMEAQRSGAGTSSYLDFITEQNEALMRVILGQTSTSKATPQGLNGKGAEVHADVKGEIVKADSDLLCESFNQTFPRWLTRWNFGEDVAPPRVYRVLDDEDDLDTIAERDVKLHGIGIERTDESIEEIYGPGYERKEPEPVPPGLEVPGVGTIPPVDEAANDDDEREQLREAFAAQDVAPLYIYRQLKKPGKLVAYARKLGLPQLTPADELHVTVLHSSAPVDWFALSDSWHFNAELKVPPGGARKLERFGEAIVLRFASEELELAHARRIRQGGSHDFPEYLPHVTLGFDPDETVDLEAFEPFIDELEFGPEIFEPLDMPAKFVAPEFTAEEEDAIALLARTLADETSPLFEAMADSLKTALAGVENPEAARVALLEAFEALPAEKMANLAGLPLVLERMAGEAGLER